MSEQWPLLVVDVPSTLQYVLPITFLIAVWFTLVRPLEKWLNMQSRCTEEERREYWQGLKANGKEQFAWRFGVLRWGLPAFAVSMPLMLLFGQRLWEPSSYDIALVGFVCLIWTSAGHRLGSYVWERLPNR